MGKPEAHTQHLLCSPTPLSLASLSSISFSGSFFFLSFFLLVCSRAEFLSPHHEIAESADRLSLFLLFSFPLFVSSFIRSLFAWLFTVSSSSSFVFSSFSLCLLNRQKNVQTPSSSRLFFLISFPLSLSLFGLVSSKAEKETRQTDSDDYVSTHRARETERRSVGKRKEDVALGSSLDSRQTDR